jgi:hypothetical protein
MLPMSIHQLFNNRAPRMPVLTWQRRLQEAHDERDVVVIARDFVATFGPDEIGRITEPWRPGKFFDANDITSYAFLLVRHDCEHQPRSAPVVHRLADFFSEASIRLSQILARRRHDDPDRDRESA